MTVVPRHTLTLVAPSESSLTGLPVTPVFPWVRARPPWRRTASLLPAMNSLVTNSLVMNSLALMQVNQSLLQESAPQGIF
ncbi:MAG: hypothetical protein HC925_04985 [Coleofasciculaceae cyanobacterium SM2_3_26]|nr:hypothetical protein [Coleofasciculaceae cyanobacterium SM2_3_26]